MGLSPDVEVVDGGAVVHCHVEEAQPLGILLPIPWFDEIEFYAVVARRGWEVVAECMSPES